jgi:hypothetical protein
MMTRNHFNKEMERDKSRMDHLPPLSIPALLQEINWYNKLISKMKRGKDGNRNKSKQ